MCADIVSDEIGRTYCKAHRREVCHVCCMSFDLQNRMAEEEAGLVKKKTDLEKAAEEKAMILTALDGMKRMMPSPNKEVWDMNYEFLKQADKKLEKFAARGEDVEAAVQKALQKERGRSLDTDAIVQAMARENPGQTHFEFGGEDTQRIYDSIVAPPTGPNSKADAYTCNYCKKTSTSLMPMCSRCKTISYCSKDCQRAAWKAHKKICIPWKGGAKEDPKVLPMTWAELEAYGGVPATGKTLEVRAILDESVMRQVVQAKDRVGDVRRIAAYTSARRIPNLAPGKILLWKNPRFHYFMDGSSGARIEEEDLDDVQVL